MPKIDLEKLKKEIPYKWRQGPSGTQLAYIDARDVQDLLDEVCGQENWQDKYEFVGEKLIAGIGINTENGWVWKYDTGDTSNIEENKGQFSDAFKRAAVKWGVGRFLYDLGTKGDEKKPYKPANVSFSKEPVSRDADNRTYCKSCGHMISENVERFSVERYGKALCMNCQKNTEAVMVVSA